MKPQLKKNRSSQTGSTGWMKNPTDRSQLQIEEIPAKKIAENTPEVAPMDKTFVADKSSSKRLKYHVIGGCFSVYENAETLFQQLSAKGFDAKMVGEYHDLHAVSYSSFATKEEALEMLSQIKSGENPHAWLLVR